MRRLLTLLWVLLLLPVIGLAAYVTAPNEWRLAVGLSARDGEVPVVRARLPALPAETGASLTPPPQAIAADPTLPWVKYAAPYEAQPGLPLIALVVTGLARDGEATQLAIDTLPAAVSLSFSPYGRPLQPWITAARAKGHEALLDLPLEGGGDSLDDELGPQALMSALPVDQNLERLTWVLGEESELVGLAAIEGARFLSAADLVNPILGAIQARGLLFVDNGGGGATTASAAISLGLPFAKAAKVLSDGPAAFEVQLAELERSAITDGSAVAIIAADPVLLEKLAAWTAALSERGFALVPVSAVIRASAAP